MYSNKLRPTKILKITKSQKAFNKVEIRHKKLGSSKDQILQMHVSDMARPRDAHASKNHKNDSQNDFHKNASQK